MAKRPTRSASRQPQTTLNPDAEDRQVQAPNAIDQAPDTGGATEGPMIGSASMASEPREEEIRMRAYRRYLERGGGDGQDFDDWVAAEEELRRPR